MAKRILVIGSGIVGASIAYHLARHGAQVTVIEAGEPGGLATRASWAWINASWGNPEGYFRLRTRSMREWKRLAEETPQVGVKWLGGLCYDLPPDKLEAYRLEHDGWGYGIRRVSKQEAAAIEPHIAAAPDMSLYVAEEGKVEPLAAAQALLNAAVALGAKLMPHQRATRLVMEGGKAIAAKANDDVIATDEIVLASGAGTVQLAQSAGYALPLTTPPGLLVHSKPTRHLLNGLVMSPELHVRQTDEGRLVAGSDFAGADPGDKPARAAQELFAKVRGIIRGGDTLELDFHTVGYRPTPRDGFPAIGRPLSVPGLYIAVMHSGITLAPAVGLFAAQEILQDRRDPLLEAYHPDRFTMQKAA